MLRDIYYYRALYSMEKYMSKRTELEYTTIQITKTLNQHIKELCHKYGWTATKITEDYWRSLVTASLSGSLSV